MWLLEPSFERELRAKLKAVGKLAAADFTQFAAHADGEISAADGPRNLKVAGDVAEISVKGLLTNKLDFWAWLFGLENTTYEQIIAALSVAATDPNVKRAVLFVDSPGGEVKGLFELFAALDAFPKPLSVRATLAASAAYGIASLGGKIEATSPAATFGSVGVVASYLHDEELIEITSTEAPDKRPDPSTEEGKAVIRGYLDAVHELFAEAIARGRGTSVDDVNANFGRGAVFIASDAKKRGMIDKAPPALKAVRAQAEDAPSLVLNTEKFLGNTTPESGSAPETQTAAPVAAQPQGKTTMDLETLKAQHPAVYAAAVAEGTAAERKRVTAHLKLADSTGATDVAHKAIREGGSVLDEDMHAEYMSAAMKRNDKTNRQADDSATGDAVDNTASAPEGSTGDIGDQVVAVMQSRRGKKGPA